MLFEAAVSVLTYYSSNGKLIEEGNFILQKIWGKHTPKDLKMKCSVLSGEKSFFQVCRVSVASAGSGIQLSAACFAP